MDPKPSSSTDDAEIARLLETIFRLHGYDFRQYAAASLRRRILRAKEHFGLESVAQMEKKICGDKAFFPQFLSELTVTVSEMFRDPHVYRVLAKEVLPVLATYPSIRIWHAGCSTGEEVYSMAILLKEEGLLERSTLYATDINPLALQKAKAGIFSASQMQNATENYQKSGRTQAFGDYYTAEYGAAVLDRSLKENVVFAEHNLATDGAFSEVHLVVCRNVFIYFNRATQNVALQLFCDSLPFAGYLCLGTKESLDFSAYSQVFAVVSADARIYQKREVG